MQELKECPFCGGESVVRMRFNTHVPTCENYKCLAYGASNGFTTREAAVKAWNTRATEREIVEAYPQKQIFIDALQHIFDYEKSKGRGQEFVGRCAYTALSRIEGGKPHE